MSAADFVARLARQLQSVGPDEYPTGYYEVRAQARADELRDQLARAYGAAIQAGHDIATVAIHVGPQVEDYLKSLCIGVNDPPTWQPPQVGLLWGFPLVLEPDARPGHVSVRTIRVIA